MGTKVSDRSTALTKATLLDTDLVAVYREDTLSAKMTVAELRKAMARPGVTEDGAATRTLTEADDGAILLFTKSDGAIAVTMADGLPLGFSCAIMRAHGASALTINGDGTVLLEDEGNAPATGNTYAVNTRGTATVAVHSKGSPDTARVFGGIS